MTVISLPDDKARVESGQSPKRLAYAHTHTPLVINRNCTLGAGRRLKGEDGSDQTMAYAWSPESQ